VKKAAALGLMAILMLSWQDRAAAFIYKWKDEKGVVHFSDTPPSWEEDVETREATDPGTSKPAGQPEEPEAPLTGSAGAKRPEPEIEPPARREGAADRVELYTTSWCPFCEKAVLFFRANRIAFRQYDVEKDADAAGRMRELGGTGAVPFARINGAPVQGFNPNRYSELLGLR